MRQFRPAELAAHIQTGHTPVLLDVREPWEWTLCRLPDAILIPMGELPARLAAQARAKFPAKADVLVFPYGGITYPKIG